jgi:sulfhydrogenase subunit beta (sulfur reductase)
MKILKMAKRDLDLFVSILPAFGEVYAPVQRGEGFAFERPSLWSDVRMNYTRTMLPPKKLMLPPRETTFSFDPNKGFHDLLTDASKPMVLFAVHAYDIYGLNILDRVFAQSKFPDPYYIARRKPRQSSASILFPTTGTRRAQ